MNPAEAAVSRARSIPDAPRRPRWLYPWGVFAALFFVASQATAILISPPEADMGHLQKILYVHVPAAWNAFIAFFIVFWAGVTYLWKRNENADMLGSSAAEVGTVLTGLTLALGSIWGKPTWGTWWTWDARLTSTAVLFLMFVGYLALRSFIEDEERRARWSAAVGIIAALNVPIVYMSVRWWRTLHQPQSTPETLADPYKFGMRLNAFAFLFLLIFFVGLRYYTARLERAAERRREEAALAGGGDV
jgi:heme exporter protein C